jgi:hypothetical protein
MIQGVLLKNDFMYVSFECCEDAIRPFPLLRTAIRQLSRNGSIEQPTTSRQSILITSSLLGRSISTFL